MRESADDSCEGRRVLSWRRTRAELYQTACLAPAVVRAADAPSVRACRSGRSIVRGGFQNDQASRPRLRWPTPPARRRWVGQAAPPACAEGTRVRQSIVMRLAEVVEDILRRNVPAAIIARRCGPVA